MYGPIAGRAQRMASRPTGPRASPKQAAPMSRRRARAVQIRNDRSCPGPPPVAPVPRKSKSGASSRRAHRPRPRRPLPARAPCRRSGRNPARPGGFRDASGRCRSCRRVRVAAYSRRRPPGTCPPGTCPPGTCPPDACPDRRRICCGSRRSRSDGSRPHARSDAGLFADRRPSRRLGRARRPDRARQPCRAPWRLACARHGPSATLLQRVPGRGI